eukprot:11186347-Lingulodinium_polyedra.AAC.1
MWRHGLPAAVPDDIARAVAAMRRFEQAADWQVNSKKSCQFANSAALRRWLHARGGGIPAGTTFRGLSVLAHAGPGRRAPVGAGRARDAALRPGRVAQLPVPFDTRCHMGAVAGTAAGMYGAACGLPHVR